MKELVGKPPMWVDGTPAGRSFGVEEKTAERFTVLLGSVAGLLRKLEYEKELFSKAHYDNPPNVDGIVYNCLNFFLTAQSMYDWFKKELKEREGENFSEASFNDTIKQKLRFHGLCRDIANTMKHADFRDGQWTGGSVKLDVLPRDGDKRPPLVILVFEQPGETSIDALGLLSIISSNWRCLLTEQGFL